MSSTERCRQIGQMRVDKGQKLLLVDKTVFTWDEDYKDMVKRLEELIHCNVVELKRLIRKEGSVPFLGYNRFGLLLQLLELEFNKNKVSTLQHYLYLLPKRRSS